MQAFGREAAQGWAVDLARLQSNALIGEACSLKRGLFGVQTIHLLPINLLPDFLSPGSLALRAAFQAASHLGLLKVAWLVPYMRTVNWRDGTLPAAAATEPPVADACVEKSMASAGSFHTKTYFKLYSISPGLGR